MNSSTTENSSPFFRDNRPENPRSAFTEIITFPSFAPHLARPEYLNNDPNAPVILPQRRSQQLRDGFQAVSRGENQALGAPSGNGAELDQQALSVHSEDSPEPEARLFGINITTEKSRPVIITTRSQKQPAPERKTHAGPHVAVLELSRTGFVDEALFAALSDGPSRYAAGTPSGPAFSVHWKGSTGGKGGAVTVNTDSEWIRVKDRLKLAPKSLRDVMVIFNISDDVLRPYLKSSAPLSDPLPPLPTGTQVPTTDDFSDQERAIGQKIMEIGAAWPCGSHGSCYIHADGQHLTFNNFRRRQFAAWIVADPVNRRASDAPPATLLTSWGITTVSPMESSRPRGRNGPSRNGSSDGDNLRSAFAEGMGLFAGVMTSVMRSSASPPSQRGQRKALSRSSSSSNPSTWSPTRDSSPEPDIRSSSPPPVEEEMEAYLESFKVTRKVPEDELNIAKQQLLAEDFTPDVLGDSSMSIARIQELTGFREGRSRQLKRDADLFAKKISVKRQRRG